MTSLYPRLLDSDWLRLSNAVRDAHLDGETKICRTGTLRVVRGRSVVARILAWVNRLPADGDAVVTNLTVSAVDEKEVWVRSFDGKIVKTVQYAARGKLYERLGFLELRFLLKVVDGNLHFQQTGAAIWLGVITIPLPKFLKPRVEAFERSVGANRTRISVAVSLPVIGLLISYAGELAEDQRA